MARCELCGNHHDKAFQVRVNGVSHNFDSIHCALQVLAPACDQCGTRILGQGVRTNGRSVRCAHCARTKH